MRDPKSRSRFKTTARVGPGLVIQSWLASLLHIISRTNKVSALASPSGARDPMLRSNSVYPDTGQIASRHQAVDAASRSVPTWRKRKAAMRRDGGFKSTT